MKLTAEQIGPCGRELYVLNTGDWRSLRPVMDPKSCQRCGQCWLVCPIGCITENEEGFQIDLGFCKGCGLCAAECNFGAIRMERELRK